eukprot:COSAG02_NODE_471_length_21662_cov_70.510040_15_plen_56_part_00
MPVVNDPSVNDPLCRRGGSTRFLSEFSLSPLESDCVHQPGPAGAVLGREQRSRNP